MAQPPRPTVTSFQLPDLISHCPFPLSYQPNGEDINAASDAWLESGCPEFTAKQRTALHGLKAGLSAAYCYPNCDDEHLRVISDFVNFLFHLDNVSDGMMKKNTEILADAVLNSFWFPHNYRPTHAPGKEQPDEEIGAGKIGRDFWSRCIQDGAPGFQARFCDSMACFFESVNIQASARDDGSIPDLKSYIDIRRDTSGCKPVFDLIEYGARIDVPDDVMEHPIIEALKLNANDLVSWSNDMFSYNVEQSRGDTHNIIIIVMKELGLTLQGAFDHVGELCHKAIRDFCENKTRLPSWGQAIDKDVAAYVLGLEDWIVGSLHWSFISERYFGKTGAEVKQTRIVKLLPRRTQPNAA